MTIVLVERDRAARRALGELLRDLGATSVLPFASPPTAFLFLVGRLRDVDAVVFNEDDDGAVDLLRRLRALPACFEIIAYSGRRLFGGFWRRAKREGAPESSPGRAKHPHEAA